MMFMMCALCICDTGMQHSSIAILMATMALANLPRSLSCQMHGDWGSKRHS